MEEEKNLHRKMKPSWRQCSNCLGRYTVPISDGYPRFTQALKAHQKRCSGRQQGVSVKVISEGLLRRLIRCVWKEGRA